MEAHKIIIGMTLVIIMVYGFLFVIAEGVDKYHPSTIPSTYNESFGRINNNLAGLSSVADDTRNKTGLQGSEDGNAVSDFLGFFFGQAYKASQVFLGGIDVLSSFVDELTGSTLLGGTAMGSVVKVVLGTIIVVIILSFLLHFVIKSDRV